ncbi:MAG: peptidylprolyl isomerase [Deltaproteobacteria bacterium]|nr:peptidylprolyl isomerase [Deltaproteobacteria bacterium]
MKIFLTLMLFVFVSQIAVARKQSIKRRPASSSDSSTIQKIQELEDHRLSSPVLLEAAKSSERTIAHAALIALGRIGDPASVPTLVQALRRKDNKLKTAAAFALGLAGGDISLKNLQQHYRFENDRIFKQTALVSIGRVGDAKTTDFFLNVLKSESQPNILAAACQGLGILLSGETKTWDIPRELLVQATKLAALADPAATACAFSLARFKGEPSLLPIDELRDALVKTQSLSAKALICRVLGTTKNAAAGKALAKELEHFSPAVRIEAAKALAGIDPNESLVPLSTKLSDPVSSVVAAALDAIGRQGPKASKLETLVLKLQKENKSPWLRETALKTLALISPETARRRALEILAQPKTEDWVASVYALGEIGNTADSEKLAQFVGDSDRRLSLAAVDGLSTLPEAKFSAGIKEALMKVLEAADAGLGASIASLVEKHKWRAFGPSIAKAYLAFKSPDHIEARVAALGALGQIGDSSYMGILQAALNDGERQVVIAAVNAIKKISGNDESSKIPLNSRVESVTPSLSEIKQALRTNVIIKTNRGEIELQMQEQAPLNAVNFVRLVKKGFYDKKTFHRVVPNFVVQGGDPRGDGYGGPGYSVRDEVSSFSHQRGVVGMATAGKDTGGCQFFINLAPNLHLDGRYTAFGKVIRGMEVADRLEVGDQIINARVVF